MRRIFKNVSAVLLSCGMAVGGSGVAHAIPFTTDLFITADTSFDTGYASVSGGATQSGNFSVKVGGVSSISTFSGTTVSGANPLSGTLTDFGDGVGSSVQAGAFAGGDLFGMGNNTNLNLKNVSTTDTYKVTFKVAFANMVNASGADAYVHSEFDVRDPGNVELFFTDVTSDTVFGNQKNGVPGGPGGIVSDTGNFFFDVTIDPSQLLTYTSMSTLFNNSGVYSSTGNASADFSAFLSVDSVTDLTRQPPAVPEPGTMALLCVGLFGIVVTRRRGR
jgi:hypothetical protein